MSTKDSIISSPSSELKYFYEHRPSSVEEEEIVGVKGKKAKYTFNSDTLNERFDYQPKKTDSTFRIITLGDSFTYGIYVNTSDNYPEQLEEKLKSFKCGSYKKFEVINLGVDGYDVQYSVERYRIRGVKYNPNLIVWFLKDDDIIQIQELTSKSIDEMIKSGTPAFDEKTREWTAYNSAFQKSLEKYSDDTILKKVEKNLSEIRKYYKNKILFITRIYTPEYLAIVEKFVKNDKNSLILKLKNIDDQKLQFIDGHLNEKGNKLVAQDVFDNLKNSILPCKLTSILPWK